MKILPATLLIILIFCASQCQQAPETPEAVSPPHRHDQLIDHHSFAKPDEAFAKHLELDLHIDFEQQILSGTARYDIENHQASRIIFDINGLEIDKATLGEKATPTIFKIGASEKFKGQPLEVAIQPDTRVVTIHYRTRPDAAALDWLEAGQTAGKRYPFLFTQGQAILTRSWIPCQDSPGIRITYNARISLPSDMMAVMSASNPQQKNEKGVYTFQMKQAIPPYLLALAAGDIEFGAIGPRSGVYAEPEMLQASLHEFADLEKMIDVAESLYGPYAWDRYDIIVLPPSFPFGGMENPRLTFATPTIIAGDRSLTALIAHELAHSWSGNLVTNATWNDFWLNEGFTVYIERRIMEALYGTDYANMLALLGYQDLEADVKDLYADSMIEDTHLFLHLKGRDPDEGLTDIAYEKGAFFLQMLEEQVGREAFDAFLKKYFETHKFQSITTAKFVEYLQKKLIEPHKLSVDIAEWIHGPGIPKNLPAVVSDKFQLVDQQLAQAVKGQLPAEAATKDWTTHEWLHFIRHLPRDASPALMKKLDQRFSFSDSGNSEILAAWFELAVRSGYSPQILSKIEQFLVKVGRRKFLTPLYRAFKESDQLETARAIYAKAKPNYHSVSRNSMEALLGLNGAQ